VIDEIGRMELSSRRFVAAIERLLDDPRPLVATIATVAALAGDARRARVTSRSHPH
jgi:nucleoside-triphosphatase THEP1